MKILFIVSVSVLSLAALILIFLHIKTLKPVKSIIVHALMGLCLMIGLNLISRFTGLRIPINIYSVVLSATLGMPAVFGFLMLNLLL